MIIISKPGAAIPYRLILPEILDDYWVPDSELLEAKTIATSTTKASFFRQLVKYDITSVKKQYTVVIDSTRAATLIAMMADINQTSWYCITGANTYEVAMLAKPDRFTRNKAAIRLEFSVIAQVS